MTSFKVFFDYSFEDNWHLHIEFSTKRTICIYTIEYVSNKAPNGMPQIDAIMAIE
ncbi:MAG: hypothetical protein IJV76_01530 [Clostridia bacterium]|nr:hypothetical protein [Clostridia bacterium]